MAKDRGIKITNIDSDKQCSIGVVVSTLVCESCKKDFKPLDKWNFHCQSCQPCKPLAN